MRHVRFLLVESLTAVKPTLNPLALTILGFYFFFRGGGVFFIDRVVKYGMKQVSSNVWLILGMETIETQTTSQINFLIMW